MPRLDERIAAVPQAGRCAHDVSVIVPVRNEAATLAPFLTSLAEQETAPGEIVVADSGSTDASADIVDTYSRTMDSMQLLRSDPGYPGRARNTAIRKARGPWIAMTDAGTIVDPAWLTELTDAAARQPEADVVFGTYEPLMRTFFEHCLALTFVAPGRHLDGRCYRGPSTASMLLRKDVWAALGGFPEDLRAGEDLVFFDRLAAAGYRSVEAPRAVVKWRIPSSWGQTFRRFRQYSSHTMKAGFWPQWQRSIVSMYTLAAIVLMLAAVVHWSLLLVPLVALVARALLSVRRRPEIVETIGRVPLGAYPMICGLLVCVDVAAITGVLDFALKTSGSDVA